MNGKASIKVAAVGELGRGFSALGVLLPCFLHTGLAVRSGGVG